MLTARRGERLRALAEELAGEIAVVEGDITDPATAQACLAAAGNTVGGIVANAGAMPIAPLASATLDDWIHTVDVNLKGVLHLVHAALRAMPAGGDIVLVSSVAGRVPFPSAAVYSATKAALNCMAEALRAETAAAMKHGGPPVRVTNILPGAVATELPVSIRDDATRAGTEGYYESLPHVLDPHDVAEAIAFALEQPPHVSINELVIRPTGMVR